MSNRWYRAYEGTVTDAKLGEVALVCECSRSVAIAAWHAILESAASSNDGGAFSTTPRRVAVVLQEAPDLIERIFAELTHLGMIEGGCVAAWKRRQFESDTSTERCRKHRERKRNADETLHPVSATPPYTETETEVDANASTARDAGAEKSDDRVIAARRAITATWQRLSNDPNRPSIDTGILNVWVASGFDPAICEAVVVSGLESALPRGKSVRSLKWFEEAVREAHDKRAPAKAPAEAPDWQALVARYSRSKLWPSPLGPAPGFAGCRVPLDILAQHGFERAA